VDVILVGNQYNMNVIVKMKIAAATLLNLMMNQDLYLTVAVVL
jgi:hypothetical protein